MDDYDKRIREDFEKDVIWLQQHLPPDDVYQFCQQALLGASFLVGKWRDGCNFQECANFDPVTRVWLQNIFGILGLQRTNVEGIINTDMDSWYDNKDPGNTPPPTTGEIGETEPCI